MIAEWRRSPRRHKGDLRARCERTVEALDLPSPFDAFAFLGILAGTRGRPIELLPVAVRPQQAPCGLLVTTDRADYIAYAEDTTYLHQQHILLHEAAHLLCRHHEGSPALSTTVGPMLPHLPAALVRRVLGRQVYTEPQEQEAELIASLIFCRAAREDERRVQSGTPATRLTTLLAAPGGRGRRG